MTLGCNTDRDIYYLCNLVDNLSFQQKNHEFAVFRDCVALLVSHALLMAYMPWHLMRLCQLCGNFLWLEG